MSLRARLAVFFTLLVGLTLTLVGVATYKFLRLGLLTEIERDVARRADTFARSDPPPPYDLDVFAAPDVFLQVTDGAGEPVAVSGNLGSRVLPLGPATRAGEVIEARIGGRPLYLTARPLRRGGFIIVARSPVTIYGALRSLRRLLFLVIGAALAVTASLGWLFGRAAVRPIERIVIAAARVKERRDLRQRVAYRGPHDEIGRLAGTFNAMLAELEGVYTHLDESNERLRQFLADVAHELRAPLALILGNLDLLARSAGTDPAFSARALADLRAETERMARMITQLLILARADSGAHVTARPVLLADIVREAGRQAQGMADGLRFSPADVRRLEGIVVQGDPDHLTQLLLILLDNAFKFTPAGGEVRLEAAVNDNRARITVADTGPGIDAEDLPHLFERFYRGRNAEGTTGTGLGLAIARWIAEQHGGDIAVESSRAGDVRIAVDLPVLRGSG